MDQDQIIFYRIRKDFSGKYSYISLGEIDGISCSLNPDSICQLNAQYLCIGLQKSNNSILNYGFALIDINKMEKFKYIKGENVTSIYYDKEKNLIIAAMEKLVDTESNFLTKIYKVIINKRDELYDDIKFEEKYEYSNCQNNYIISIEKVMLDLYKNYIFATYSQDCELEVVGKELEKLE